MKNPSMTTRTTRRRAPGQRLGAIGMTAALGLFGGGALLQRCAPAPKPAPSIIPLGSEMVNLVNSYRAQNGVGPVSENAQLDSAAENHSIDQAQRLTMTHTGWNGSTAGQRISAAGFAWRTWGENVAVGQPTVAAVMTAWMNSAGHRANILNPAFTSIGVAGSKGTNGAIYWTMDLAAGR